jgi:hypothetical protein
MIIIYIKYKIKIPSPANIMANKVNGQKYFFTSLLACSWNFHNKNPAIANRLVLNNADTPKNKRIGKCKNPAQIATNLYGTGVNAVTNKINMPFLANICFANSNLSIVAKLFISQTPTESNNHSPIKYVIAPPINDPNAAEIVTGRARFLSATIGGVMNASGGINKNIDSQTVRKNTTQTNAGCADFFKILSINFI